MRITTEGVERLRRVSEDWNVSTLQIKGESDETRQSDPDR
jgi:hypothetical protein